MTVSGQLTDWSYRLPKRSAKGEVVLLKAHGSIDWFKTEDITFISRRRRFFLDQALGYISVINSWDYSKSEGGEELIPFIIPPTSSKSFQQGEIMGIWVDIYKALQRAEKIYIFGYSLPEADLHTKFILRAAIERNPFYQVAMYEDIVQVFNPDLRVRETFTDVLGRKFLFRNVKFEDYDFDEIPSIT